MDALGNLGAQKELDLLVGSIRLNSLKESCLGFWVTIRKTANPIHEKNTASKNQPNQ